jgi:ABC-type transport system involved in multi-copper enzyme maturation permease subunit
MKDSKLSLGERIAVAFTILLLIFWSTCSFTAALLGLPGVEDEWIPLFLLAAFVFLSGCIIKGES